MVVYPPSIVNSADVGNPVTGNTGVASASTVGAPSVNIANEVVSGAGGIGPNTAIGWHAVMDPAYTTFMEFDAQNVYMKSLQGPHGKVEFSQAPILGVEVINVLDPASPRAVSKSYSASATSGAVFPNNLYATGVVTQPDYSFTINHTLNTDPNLYQADLTYTMRHSSNEGSVLIEPTLTMGSTFSPSQSFHYAHPVVRIKPFGDPADCRVLIGIPGARVFYLSPGAAPADQGISSFEGTLAIDGTVSRGGSDHPEDSSFPFVTTDEPSPSLSIGSPGYAGVSHLPLVYLWNRKTREGCLVRFNDKNDRGKFLTIQRDAATNDLIVGVKMVPKDNSLGNNGGSDGPLGYSIEVRPMRGDWYDALRYVKVRSIAEGHPAYAKGRIKDRSDFPVRAKNALAFGAMTINRKDRAELFDYNRFVDNTARIVSNLGIKPEELMMSLYEFWKGLMGEVMPTFSWEVGAAAAVRAIYDSGVTTILYTIPISPMKLNTYGGLPFGAGVYNELPLNRAQQPITGAKPAFPATTIGEKFNPVNFRDEQNMEEITRLFVQSVKADPQVLFHGIYDDAGNGYMTPDDSNLLAPPESRGIGSLTWGPNNRKRVDLSKKVLKDDAGLSDPIVITEHANFRLVGNADVQFDNSHGPGNGHFNNTVPAQSALWSDYQVVTNFAGYADGPGNWFVTGVEDKITDAEVFSGLYGTYFHRGHVPPFLKFFAVISDPYFPDDMPSDYIVWRDFMKIMFVKYGPLIRHYRQSDRLRELPGSLVDFHIELFLKNPTNPAPDDIFVDQAHVGSSVWHDTDSDVICVFFSNHSLPEGNPRMVYVDHVMTLTDYPALGSSPRKVRMLSFKSDDVAALPDYDGSGSYRLRIPVGPGNVYAVELIPESTPSAGMTPGVNMKSRNILVTWPDDLSDTLSHYEITKGPSSNPAVVKTASSYYLDTEVYNDTSSMESVVYTVKAVQTTLVKSPIEAAEVTLDVSKQPVGVDKVCMIAGNVQDLAGGVPMRSIIRAEPYRNLTKADQIYLKMDVTTRANFEGDFVIPAPRGSVIRVVIPNAELHTMVVVPDSGTANLIDLERREVSRYTNN